MIPLIVRFKPLKCNRSGAIVSWKGLPESMKCLLTSDHAVDGSIYIRKYIAQSFKRAIMKWSLSADEHMSRDIFKTGKETWQSVKYRR